MPAKEGAAREQERTTGRKYSGGDSDKAPGPGEHQQFWVSGHTRKDGEKVEGYDKKNPAHKGDAS